MELLKLLLEENQRNLDEAEKQLGVVQGMIAAYKKTQVQIQDKIQKTVEESKKKKKAK